MFLPARPRHNRRLFSLLVLIIFIMASLMPTASFAQSSTVSVQRVDFPVVLSDNQSYTVAGYLYTLQGNLNNSDQCRKRADTIQVALHGGSYNHKYWDAGVINGVDYSYAQYMASQCYSVLALDRLGTGASSKPNGDFISLAVEADSISQILSSLRHSRNPIHRKFKRIVLVGHSWGSLLSVYTLGEYGNVADGLVATGWLNAPGTTPITPEIVGPLLGEPEVRSSGELRSFLFYFVNPDNPGNVSDPLVVAHDNQYFNDIIPRAYFLDAIAVFAARAAADEGLIKTLTRVDQVNVPVFVQTADQDILFPTAFAGPEASYYTNAPSVTVNHLENTGHSFNLYPTHLVGWQQIEQWINETIVNG